MAPDVPRPAKRSYQHFCPAARALETIGERWSLLIVRDLLAGPRRFSDLRRSLAAITPKWLSARLRALEADGIVAREVAGEREVWYRLTPKGQALEPVFDEYVKPVTLLVLMPPVSASVGSWISRSRSSAPNRIAIQWPSPDSQRIWASP